MCFALERDALKCCTLIKSMALFSHVKSLNYCLEFWTPVLDTLHYSCFTLFFQRQIPYYLYLQNYMC